jgi:hypothetical protein
VYYLYEVDYGFWYCDGCVAWNGSENQSWLTFLDGGMRKINLLLGLGSTKFTDVKKLVMMVVLSTTERIII